MAPRQKEAHHLLAHEARSADDEDPHSGRLQGAPRLPLQGSEVQEVDPAVGGGDEPLPAEVGEDLGDGLADGGGGVGDLLVGDGNVDALPVPGRKRGVRQEEEVAGDAGAELPVCRWAS